MDRNEQLAATAFTRQSGVFDALFSGNAIIQYKRKRVRDRIQEYLAPGSTILELNSGTGEDAIWFAQSGYEVHATDISAGMQEVLKRKVAERGLTEAVSTERFSFTQLNQLKKRGPYDLIFSNFAGLNCTGDLNLVLDAFDHLLNPGGLVVLVLMPKYCLWEMSLVFKGEFRTAFRRWFGKRGVKARVEGTDFTCWYYSPSYLIRRLAKRFDLLQLEGLCSLVPPSYLEGFPEKYPRLYQRLVRKEENLKDRWPWNRIGDYYIITWRKKP
jgi:ubiquinone/menaquinone biosynthesis C-methylase UbiE